MEILARQQILDKQIKLLNLPGRTLSNFHCHDFEQKIFVPPSLQIVNKIYELHKLKDIKTSAEKANSPFYILTFIMLNTISQQLPRTDLLQKIKCTLYSQKINLIQIIGRPHNDLDSNCMKKLIAEVLQIVKYHVGNVQVVLSRYPIILEIFSIFFRFILKSISVEDAQNYNKAVNNIQAVTSILDFFDFVYFVRKNLIVLENQKSLCIYIDQKTDQCFMGQRCNDVLKNIQTTLQIEQKQQIDHTELKRIQEYTPTPCFGQVSWEDPQGLAHRHNQNLRLKKSNNFQVQEIEQNAQSNSSKIYDQFSQQNMNPFDSINSTKQNNGSPTLQNFNKLLQGMENYSFGVQQQKLRFEKKNGYNQNPELNMKISDIRRQQNQQFNEQKRQTLSQRAKVRQRSITDQQSQTLTKMSQYTYKHENCRIQAVLQLKISPTAQQKFNTKRFKTAITSIQQLKFIKKREKNAEINNSSKINGTKTFGKFPAFLAQKNAQNKTSRNSKSPITYTDQSPSLYDFGSKKPKVNFTYSNNIPRNSNSSFVSNQLQSNPLYEKVSLTSSYNYGNFNERVPIYNMSRYNNNLSNRQSLSFINSKQPQSKYYFKQ